MEAYISPTQVNIKQKDNEALIYYLKQYESKFRGYRESAFDKLSFIEDKDKESAQEWYHNYLKRHKYLDMFCDNALGESLYYEALLHSWYNDSCKYDRASKENHTNCQKCKENETETDCKQLHRLALNTKNAIDSIKIIKLKNKHLFDYKNSEYTVQTLENIGKENSLITKLIRKSDIVAFSSLLLGAISVALAFYSLKLTNKINSTSSSEQTILNQYPTTQPADSLPLLRERTYSIEKDSVSASK